MSRSSVTALPANAVRVWSKEGADEIRALAEQFPREVGESEMLADLVERAR